MKKQRGEKFTYVGLQPWMVMMERARTVIPGYGKDATYPETPYKIPTYEEQLKARAVARLQAAHHNRRVAAITGITPEMQQLHYLQAAQDHEERMGR